MTPLKRFGHDDAVANTISKHTQTHTRTYTTKHTVDAGLVEQAVGQGQDRDHLGAVVAVRRTVPIHISFPKPCVGRQD